MRIAITRAVSPAIELCELTHRSRESIDLARTREQHAAYEECLARLGCRIERLPEDRGLPDSVFVEDCAVVLDEVAIVTRPGAASRRAETMAIEGALLTHRPIARIAAPDTLDGGDVLRVDRTLFVGLSTRTTPGAIDQLRAVIGPFGYKVVPAEVRGCLHLKSAASEVAPGVLLVNPRWTGDWVARFDCIEVDPAEQLAANALRIGDAIVYPSTFRRTRERLDTRGLTVSEVDVSELQKAEGAVTCCSLVFEAA